MITFLYTFNCLLYRFQTFGKTQFTIKSKWEQIVKWKKRSYRKKQIYISQLTVFVYHKRIGWLDIAGINGWGPRIQDVQKIIRRQVPLFAKCSNEYETACGMQNYMFRHLHHKFAEVTGYWAVSLIRTINPMTLKWIESIVHFWRKSSKSAQILIFIADVSKDNTLWAPFLLDVPRCTWPLTALLQKGMLAMPILSF